MARSGSRILWSLFLRLVVATGLAGAAAWWYTGDTPERYRARALLVLAPLPFEELDERTNPIALVPDAAQLGNNVRVDLVETMPMPDYGLLLTSEEVAAQVRDHVIELYAEADMDRSGLTLEQVQGAMDVRTQLFAQTAREVLYQDVVELLYTADTPEIAAAATNFWAEAAIEMTARVAGVARRDAAAFLGERLDAAHAELGETRAAIEALHAAHYLPGIEEELDALYAARAGLRARAATDEEAAAQRAALDAPIQALQATLAEQTQRLDALELRREAQARHVQNLELSHAAARLAAANTAPDLKLAMRAVPPQQGLAYDRMLLVLAVMLVAAAAVPVHFFGMVALRRYAAQIEAAERS